MSNSNTSNLQPGGSESTPDTDSWLTVQAQSFVEIKIQHSRFLGFAFPARATDEFQSVLDALRKEHHAASHHCFAYRLHAGTRFSDDGEPTNTAGRRILGAIERHDLYAMAVIVVRYFGGVKLGTGGLAQAYMQAANEAIEANTILRMWHRDRIAVSFPYDMTNQVHHVVEQLGATILTRDYENTVTYEIEIRRSLSAQLISQLELATQRTIVVRQLTVNS